MEQARVSIALLGPVSVRSGAAVLDAAALGGRRGVVVLARLAVVPGRDVAVDALAETVWPVGRPSAWRPALRNVVSGLRAALADVESGGDGPAISIESGGQGYRLVLGPDVEVDVGLVLAAADAAASALAAGDPAAALALVDGAVGLLGEEFLGSEDGDWVAAMRTRIHTADAQLHAAGARAALDLGLPARAESLAIHAIERDPLREDGHRMLMSALVASGNRGAALAAYEACRAVLVERLGTEPSAATRELFVALLHDPEGEAREATAPLLMLQAGTPFVGRSEQLATLQELVTQLPAAGSVLVRVTGEPGIGKTRLAAEIAALAHAGGLAVLYGRADDRLDVPYRPFVEALNSHLAVQAAAERRAVLGPHGAVLAARLPAARDVVAAAPGTGIPDLDRQHFFRAVTAVLGRIATGRGALLILDDLQWGGAASEALLDHVVRSVTEPLVVLAVSREEGGAGVSVPLPGLDVAEVAALARHEFGERADLDLIAQAVWSDTGGNPLFATAALADGPPDLAATGAVPVRSARVQHLVRQRVGVLPRRTRQLLDVAAVAGLEFDPVVVAAAAGLPADRAEASLAQAESDGLLTVAAADHTLRAFRHALVRDCLLEDLAQEPERRRQIHDSLTGALESFTTGRAAPTELAYHAGAAASPADWQRAVRYGRSAARLAAESLVHDDVVAVVRRSLDVLADAGDPDPAARLELTVLLGAAQRGLGDPAGHSTLTEVFAQAQDAGESLLMAEAALAFSQGGAAGDELFIDDSLVGLYEAALAALPPGEQRLRARLLGRLATAYGWLRDAEASRRYSAEALELAAEVGDLGTLSTVLTNARRGLSGAGRPHEEVAIEQQLLEIAATLDDPGMAAGAWLWRFESGVELAEGAALDDALERARENIATIGPSAHQYTLAYATASLLLLRGKADDADAAVEAAFELGAAAGINPMVINGIRLIQLMGVRHEQGRLGDLRGELLEYFGQAGVPEWEGAIAFADAESGHLDSVPGYLDKVFAGYATGGIRTGVGLAFAAHMAAPIVRVRDLEKAKHLYEMVLPHSGFGGYVAYFVGPLDYQLGLLAELLGDVDGARRHFTAAEEFSTRLGAPRWTARCAEALARVSG